MIQCWLSSYRLRIYSYSQLTYTHMYTVRVCAQHTHMHAHDVSWITSDQLIFAAICKVSGEVILVS